MEALYSTISSPLCDVITLGMSDGGDVVGLPKSLQK